MIKKTVVRNPEAVVLRSLLREAHTALSNTSSSLGATLMNGFYDDLRFRINKVLNEAA